MASKRQGAPRPKHVPLRTCVACREGSAKRELVRIVRTPAGAVQIDPTGKLSGRGAYLCRRRACWELAAKKRMIERALQVTLDQETKTNIERFIADLAE